MNACIEQKKNHSNTAEKSRFLLVKHEDSEIPPPVETQRLELLERLDGLSGPRKNTENVESNGLAQRSALANNDLVTLLNTERRRYMGGYVLVALLVTVVLRDVVEIVTPDDKCSVHLGGDNGTAQDTSTDGDETSERAFLVNIGALNGGLGGLEAQSNILVPSPARLSYSALRWADLLSCEDMRLLLECALGLDGKFGGHDCCSVDDDP